MTDNTEDDYEGQALWSAVTKTVTPLQDEDDTIAFDRAGSPEQQAAPPIKPKLYVRDAKAGKTAGGASRKPGLDARTEKRFRQGKMDIDARLDLHGMTRIDAQNALRDFIQRGYRQGWRCVLVITGKGRKTPHTEARHWLDRDPPGVLKRKVPEWLFMPPLGSLILRTAPAKRRHGGGGALYVLIRRKR